MKSQGRAPKKTRNRAALLAPLALALLCLGLLTASSASAGYEQVGTFAGTPNVFHNNEPFEWPEEVQLGQLGGMAVNYTGAGGVPKGTIYAATFPSGTGLARYNPDGSFSERWTFDGTLGGAPNERCGPEGDPAKPTCNARPSGGAQNIDVDVDQSTGNVYVLREGANASAGTNLIHVYTPDGSKLIAEFGEKAAVGETIAASPAKIHLQPANGGIAVNADGDVYVSDEGQGQRLMEFVPQSAGDHEHYVYAGQSHDITIPGGALSPARPVADAAGDLYVARGPNVAKLDPSEPSDPVVCNFKFGPASIESIAVDPLSGEVFLHSNNLSVNKKIYRLNPCDEASGKFEEAGTILFSPSRNELSGMAFDPLRQPEASRPAGVLYAGSPDGAGGNTQGEPPNTKVESSLGFIFAHPKALPPQVLSQSAAHVSATTAALVAQVNPRGSLTSYAFQYETQAQYEANEPSDRFAGAPEAPPGGGVLGEGSAPLSASASISGLSPDTTYRFRTVATSHCAEDEPEKVCEASGEDASFRTFPLEAPGLPDHRAYELVSPAQKEGGQVVPADSRSYLCGLGCKPGGAYARFPRQVAPSGEAIAYEGTPFSSAGATVENEYVSRRDPKAGWQTIDVAPPLLNNRRSAFLALDTNLTRGLLSQESPVLSPEAPEGFSNLYAQPDGTDPQSLNPLVAFEPRNRTPFTFTFAITYAGASRDLSRVFFSANDALTEETPFAPEAEDGGVNKRNLYEWHEGELALVNVAPGNTETEPGAAFGAGSAHSVSNDGSHAFFEDEAHQVYVRIDGEETIEVPAAGKFLNASTDGSKVLLSSGALHDLQSEETTDLGEEKGGFQGIVGESEDLSHIYFVDTEVLSGEEENGQHQKAQKGKNNLYAWAEGEGTHYVATLASGDNGGGTNNLAHDWVPLPSARTAEASPEGRYLAFLSEEPLTGYDSTGPCEGTNKGYVPAPCPEVFLYDSQSAELRCASCNPTGTAPQGFSTLRLIADSPPSLPQPRYLTDEGRLYFDSADSLAAADTNVGAEDVYEFEPSGVGTCEREAGCLSLLSAGTEPTDSNLLAIDETGKNVFFTTRDKLALKDTDDLIDLYDAREDGGIPSETEVARGECQGEACQPLVSAPNDPTPGSSTFEGAGNVDEKKAAKKHKKAKKKKKAKKHAHKRAARHNRGGAK